MQIKQPMHNTVKKNQRQPGICIRCRTRYNLMQCNLHTNHRSAAGELGVCIAYPISPCHGKALCQSCSRCRFAIKMGPGMPFAAVCRCVASWCHAVVKYACSTYCRTCCHVWINGLYAAVSLLCCMSSLSACQRLC